SIDLNSLFLHRTLPSGKVDYTVRQTGVELYQLAVYLDKPIRFLNFPEGFDIANFTNDINKHENISASDHEAGSVEVVLPLPIDIFTSRRLDSCFGYSYDISNPSTLRTVIETIANYYFDNPYAIYIEG